MAFILAGNPASSEYVKQELRAVVSGRAAAAANSGGNNAPGVGTGSGPGSNIPTGLRVSTPQSPHGSQTSQGPLLGTNSTNPISMAQQQSQTSKSVGNVSNTSGVGSSAGSGSSNTNSLLNTPPDPTLGFSFDARKLKL